MRDFVYDTKPCSPILKMATQRYDDKENQKTTETHKAIFQTHKDKNVAMIKILLLFCCATQKVSQE
jgi:hypothetical protein